MCIWGIANSFREPVNKEGRWQQIKSAWVYEKGKLHITLTFLAPLVVMISITYKVS